MTSKRNPTESTPEAQLRAYIAKLEPKHQKLARAVRTALRKRFPTANELAYDYGHSLVVSYSPTDRGIDAVVAFTARATGLTLHFNQGPRLPDPKGLLLGSGKQTRFVPIEAANRLSHPDIDALIAAAAELATIPLAPTGKGCLVVKETAAKKRSRPTPTKRPRTRS
jgi:hypothetical protein